MITEDRKAYHREYARRRRAEDPNYGKAAKAKYRETVKGQAKEKEYGKAYQKKHPGRCRAHSFKSYHGVSREEADAMIEAQNGFCAICNRLPKGKGNCSRLHVDHDHETGKIRKMLCTNCNRALGLVGEDVETLRSMIDYLTNPT